MLNSFFKASTKFVRGNLCMIFLKPTSLAMSKTFSFPMKIFMNIWMCICTSATSVFLITFSEKQRKRKINTIEKLKRQLKNTTMEIFLPNAQWDHSRIIHNIQLWSTLAPNSFCPTMGNLFVVAIGFSISKTQIFLDLLELDLCVN